MSAYTNKHGITIKHGDKVRVLSEIARLSGETINPGTIATAEYHEATNREPFWVLNVGGEWNPMESHSELVAMFEVVELADTPTELERVKEELLTAQKLIEYLREKNKEGHEKFERAKEINKRHHEDIQRLKLFLEMLALMAEKSADMHSTHGERRGQFLLIQAFAKHELDRWIPVYADRYSKADDNIPF